MTFSPTLLPLATAFGLALLHSLWIGLFLYCCLRSVLPFLTAPRARHHAAFAALLVFTAGFGYAVYANYDAGRICENLLVNGLPRVTISEIIDGTPVTAAAPEPFLDRVTRELPNLAPWLSLVYLFGMLPTLLGLGRDQFRSRRLRSVGLSALPDSWAGALDAELFAHPATRRVRLYLSERAGEVMTLGFWSPVIVFPVALAGQLTPAMARAIVLHELAHLRHYDHLLNHLQQVLKTLFFYHPFVHFLGRVLDREREHRCDDWVVRHGADRRTYASALVLVARQVHQPFNSLAMSATKTPFSARVRRLFGEDERPRGQFVFAGILVVLLALTHFGYNNFSADAGAVDCLREQGGTAIELPNTPTSRSAGKAVLPRVVAD